MLLLFIQLFLLSTTYSLKDCKDPNAIFNSCASPCDEYCGFKPTGCNDLCAEKCVCKDGFVLNKEGGICIKRELCPKEISPTQATEDKSCPLNQIFDECGSFCPDTCGKRNVPCFMLCRRGCKCEQGFVRETNYDSKCVKVEECSKTETKTTIAVTEDKSCPLNQIWDDCGTSCPESCDRRGRVPCFMLCNVGCRCKEGFILTKQGSKKCVKAEQCPTDKKSKRKHRKHRKSKKDRKEKKAKRRKSRKSRKSKKDRKEKRAKRRKSRKSKRGKKRKSRKNKKHSIAK